MTACKTGSSVPSKLLTVEPEKPEVRCKQQAAPTVRSPPAASEWVEWRPPTPGQAQGTARLSEAAVLWIAETLAVTATLRELRRVEHECLDDAERRGLIRQ